MKKDSKESPQKIRLHENLMHKAFNKTNEKMESNYIHILNNGINQKAFIQAISLHNCALESNEKMNQLLNLWTIVELLIDFKRDNEDKINTISNVLVAVLNRKYIYSQIEQLTKDLIKYGGDDVKTILESIEIGNTTVEKLAAILSLKKEAEINAIIDLLDTEPLLVYRINFFKDKVLNDNQSIYKFILRHTDRLRWQIMRIYRNRNMIVHSGKSMPYRDIIIGNLHYYVDTLINSLLEYYIKGYKKNNIIYLDILKKDFDYFNSLGNLR